MLVELVYKWITCVTDHLLGRVTVFILILLSFHFRCWHSLVLPPNYFGACSSLSMHSLYVSNQCTWNQRPVEWFTGWWLLLLFSLSIRLFVTPWTIAYQVPLVHGIFQARILNLVAISSSRGSSRPRDWTRVSCIGRLILLPLSHQGTIYMGISVLKKKSICAFKSRRWLIQTILCTQFLTLLKEKNQSLKLITCHRMGCSILFAAAAAESLQLCLTLCDPVDGSPPGSAIPGILQARILEWVAISFSNAWKWKVVLRIL